MSITKTKIKPYGYKVTYFYDKEIPMVDSNHTFLSITKTKIKPYGYKVTYFYDKEIPMVDSNHTFLAVKDGNYYPQVFLKECKYIEKNIISSSYF